MYLIISDKKVSPQNKDFIKKSCLSVFMWTSSALSLTQYNHIAYNIVVQLSLWLKVERYTCLQFD